MDGTSRQDELDAEAAALRDALVRFVLESSLGDPRVAALGSTLEKSVAALAQQQGDTARSLERQIKALQASLAHGASDQLAQLEKKVNALVQEAALEHQFREAARDRFVKILNDTEVIWRIVKDTHKDVATLQKQLKWLRSAVPDRSRDVDEPCEPVPGAVVVSTLPNGLNSWPEEKEGARWTSRRHRLIYALFAAGFLLVISLATNFIQATHGTRAEQQGPLSAAPPEVTRKEPVARKGANVAHERRASEIEDPPAGPSWDVLWRKASELPVSACTTAMAGDSARPVMTLRACACPRSGGSAQCKPADISDPKHQVAALQAVLAAFDSAAYGTAIDGKLGSYTLDALDRMVDRCWRDYSDLRQAAADLRSDFAAARVARTAQPSKQRDLIESVLKQMSIAYTSCEHPAPDAVDSR